MFRKGLVPHVILLAVIIFLAFALMGVSLCVLALGDDCPVGGPPTVESGTELKFLSKSQAQAELNAYLEVTVEEDSVSDLWYDYLTDGDGRAREDAVEVYNTMFGGRDTILFVDGDKVDDTGDCQDTRSVPRAVRKIPTPDGNVNMELVLCL